MGSTVTRYLCLGTFLSGQALCREHPNSAQEQHPSMIRRWLKSLLNQSAEDGIPEVPIKSLTTRDELDAALAAPVVVLYKHSPICAVSTWSLREVQRFEREHPDTTVYHIDVIHHRDLSNWIAQHFGIRHESPQALVVRNGRDVWATSHSGITAAALRKQVTPSGESPE